MLTDIANLFDGQLSSGWTDKMQDWGERVYMYRDYVEGRHRTYLTGTMRRMLNVTGEKYQTFSADYTDMVVRMMAERLVVDRIEASPHPPTPSPNSLRGRGGDTPQTAGGDMEADAPLRVPTGDDDGEDLGQAWVDRLLKKNRFDALQMDVHESTVRDGDAFIIVDYDEDRQCARLNFNQAFDGSVGVIPVYSRSQPDVMLAAVKVMYVGEEQKQVNVYYADRVEKYITDESGVGMTSLGESEPWGAMFPVIHFSNRRRRNESVGVSELQKVITLQDILNRILVSMVMSSELSAFQLLFAKGFQAPSAITPGMIISHIEDDPNNLGPVDLKAIPQAQLTEFINEINKLIDLIAEVTQTPIASVMGNNPSGEALKQREVGLLSKVEGAMVKLGNSWEDVLMVAHSVERVYSAVQPPAIDMFDCKWADAQVRNDKEVIEIAGMVYDKIGNDRLYLEMVAEVKGWDEVKIQQILDYMEEKAQSSMAMTNFMGALGEFAQLDNGVQGEGLVAS